MIGGRRAWIPFVILSENNRKISATYLFGLGQILTNRSKFQRGRSRPWAR